MNKQIAALIDLLPSSPGVYLMEDEEGRIIYIGKAKSLKKRVSQYFLRPQSDPKVAAMVDHVSSFKTILVNNDKEAFLLERNLIKEHNPYYNILLLDDSRYPYISLKKKGYPYLKISRNNKDKNFYHFGPYSNATSAREIITLLDRAYPLRKCKNMPSKPCLFYSIGQCPAPCINKFSQEEINALIEKVLSFFRGDNHEVTTILKEKMEEASLKTDYESAAEYKKSLDAIEHIKIKQSVEGDPHLNCDVFSCLSKEGYFALAVLFIRGGILQGEKTFVVDCFGEMGEQFTDLIGQYYEENEIPKLIVASLEDALSLKDVLDTEIRVPSSGKFQKMVELAEANAREALKKHFASVQNKNDNLSLLIQLGDLLHIKTPYRIELFDNSHLQGSNAVGAMVCFINGEKAKNMYRRFRLDSSNAGDDYHSMVEVAYRRYKRLKEEASSYPDLILADGGITQVRAVKEGLTKAEVEIPVFGLFKNDKHQTEGLIDENGDTYPLDRHSPLFFLLMRMQDEVHRYAISYHIKSRSKSMMSSFFDSIEGIGPKRIEAILNQYQSKEDLLNASIEELSQLLPLPQAKALYEKLHPKKE